MDACTDDADCRTAEGYRCASFGGAVGNLCRHPHVGDACATDAECGDPAAWDCVTGVSFPGGLCTVPVGTCPTPGLTTGCSATSSSVCAEGNTAAAGDNVCVNRCAGPAGTQSGCRTGWLCSDVDPSPARTTLGCVAP